MRRAWSAGTRSKATHRLKSWLETPTRQDKRWCMEIWRKCLRWICRRTPSASSDPARMEALNLTRRDKLFLMQLMRGWQTRMVKRFRISSSHQSTTLMEWPAKTSSKGEDRIYRCNKIHWIRGTSPKTVNFKIRSVQEAKRDKIFRILTSFHRSLACILTLTTHHKPTVELLEWHKHERASPGLLASI